MATIVVLQVQHTIKYLKKQEENDMSLNYKNLFLPEFKKTQEYGQRLTDLFVQFSYSSKDEKIEGLKIPLDIGNIPFVLRTIGIPAGTVTLLPNNIPHMIGFGQEKTNSNYRNMHNLNLEEMLAIPNMLSNPDMIFRSNTQPNTSIILCKEIQNREKPVILAMKIAIKDTLNSAGIVVSGYEKDKSPDSFFSNLYSNGYCVYDSEESEYFNDIKFRIGARGCSASPMPAGAVASTAPSNKVLTKNDIIKKYKENSNEIITVINKDKKTALLANRNLIELGYHTVIPNALDSNEVASLFRASTAIACDRDMIKNFSAMREKLPNIKRIGQAIDFMPKPIFSTELNPIQEILSNKNKTKQR